MRKINEIFYSLQGEGAHSGTPAVFIRFSGCNLSCPFCDTRHQKGKFISDEEIAETATSYPAEWIILTGGEPSLHIDGEFIRYIKEVTGKKIAIETNGTTPLPPGIDWVTLSPKVGIAGEDSADMAIVRITDAHEIKVVDTGQDLEQYFKLPCKGPHTRMYLQPCFVEEETARMANRSRTIERVLSDPRWILSPQLHRFLGIP